MIESSIVAATVSVVQSVTRITLAHHCITDQINKGGRDGLQDLDCGDVELKLDISLQKLLRWQKLWTGDGTRSGDFWQRLWGHSGCISILELLAKIQEDCSGIGEATIRLGGVRGYANEKRSIKRPLRLPNLPQCFRVALKRQDSKFEEKEIRTKVERLGYHVDQLWTKSEMEFQSHNGTQAEDTQPLGEGRVILDSLVKRRSESAALYWYCNSRDLDFDLEIDLFGSGTDVKPAAGLASRLGRCPCYHLFTASSIDSVTFNDLLVVPLDRPEAEKVRQSEVVYIGREDSKSKDLALIASKSKILSLRDSQTGSQYFFRVTLPVKVMDASVKSEVLATILEKLQRRRVLDVSDRLPVVEKIRLAYKIVECGLFLLGTPWLSHLNSQTLRQIVLPNFQSRYVLHVQSTERPEAEPVANVVPVSAQIFQIGVLLVEIALDRPLYSVGMEDLKLGSSTILYVERSMGHRYKQACEFCLTRKVDGGFLPDHEDLDSDGLRRRPDPDWIFKQYYSEVFIRLDDVHKQAQELSTRQ